jgi:hypothetical protein
VYDRDPITGPVGVVLCGGGGGVEVVGLGGVVGCGCVGAGSCAAVGADDDAAVEEGAACASLMAPPLRSSGALEPCSIGAPLGRSAGLLPPVDATAFLVSCPGCWLVLLQAAAAQTRAAATAVAAALAGATVPLVGMDATVAK